MYVLQTLCGVSNVSRSLGCSRPYRVSCNHITTCLCVYTRPWANPLKLRSAQHGSSACTTLCAQHVQVIQSKETQHFTACNMPLIWFCFRAWAAMAKTKLAWKTRNYNIDSEGAVCMLVKVSICTVVRARVAVGWTLAHNLQRAICACW